MSEVTTAVLLLQLLIGALAMPAIVKRSDDTDPMAAVVQQLSTQVSELRAQLSADEARIAALEHQVAFSAEFSFSTLHAPTAGPYKFDHVVFNDGNGYNSISGIFTAPVSGVYSFSFQVFTHAAERPLLDIMVNGAIKRRAAFDTTSLNNPNESAVSTLMISLSQGDQVWVENNYDQDLDIYGGVHSFFAGALVHAH